jgi:phosphoglycolate phosphatase
MKRTLLLFDIDGTLLLSGGAGMRSMHLVAERMFGADFSWDGVYWQGSLDPLIFADALAKNGIEGAHHHEIFREQYLAQLKQDLAAHRDQVQIMPGVQDMLELLRQRVTTRDDVVLGMLTGNFSRAVPLKLATINVDPAWFKITAFGDEAPTRPELVALAMRKYEAAYDEPADPQRVWIIGDTPRDVDCAHANGCRCLAVMTGFCNAEDLRDADVLVKDLADPAPLLALIDPPHAHAAS